MHVDPCSWGFKLPGFQIAFPCIKNNKQKVKNYRRISLLPVSNKIFERLLCDSMFKFFTENNLISQNQSRFKPGDSSTNQLLSITHQIYKSFDDCQEVGFVFLKFMNFGMTQGCYFQIKAKWNLTTNVRLFAEDILLFSVVDNINLSTTNLNSDLSKINVWASQRKMTFNPDPNKHSSKNKEDIAPSNFIITLLSM